MQPRHLYLAEPSLIMNAERPRPKLPLCPSCALNMRLIRRTQRFGELPDVCMFECRGCGVSLFEEYAAETTGPMATAITIAEPAPIPGSTGRCPQWPMRQAGCGTR
jgi:hypothetical protein